MNKNPQSVPGSTTARIVPFPGPREKAKTVTRPNNPSHKEGVVELDAYRKGRESGLSPAQVAKLKRTRKHLMHRIGQLQECVRDIDEMLA